MQKLFVLGLSFMLLACSTQEDKVLRKNPEMNLSESSPDKIEMQTLRVGDQQFFVEVASTPDQRQMGLMNRESMPANQGMLFVFEGEGPRNFWMKNTLIPLDMIWINANREIVDIKAAEPCEVVVCPTYEGEAPAQYVLELNQGVLRAQIGDTVQF